VLCVIAGQLPIVNHWGLYIVPLKYLTWIGCAWLAVAGMIPVWAIVSKGPYRYIEEGLPIVARVRNLALLPSKIVNGQKASFRYVAAIDFRDPATGAVRTAEVASRDISASARARLTTSFRAGDYVTAVHLLSDPDKTLRLYGFLELRPGLGIIQRESYSAPGPLKIVATVSAVFAFFFVLGWNVYAFGRYEPRHLFNSEQLAVLLIAGVVLGGAWIGAMAYSTARDRRRRAQRNAQAAARGEPVEVEASGKKGWFGNHGIFLGLVVVAGSVLLSGVTALCWAYTANAWFDRSPPKLEPVQVVGLIEETRKLLIRSYFIEYRFLAGDDKKRQFLSTPDEMSQFKHKLAVAEVHEGWLGWQWVKSIAPLNVRDPAAKEPK